MDRQSLLKKAAAVAGAVYFAPVLTSAAGAGTSACAPLKCKVGHPKKGDTKCARKNGGNTNCKCVANGDAFPKGTCKEAGGCSPCQGCVPESQSCCGPLVTCGACGNGGCFCNAASPGTCTCINIKDGFCSSFQPCNGTSCPAGQCCFNSCCGTPLCADTCAGASSGRASARQGGAGMLFRG